MPSDETAAIRDQTIRHASAFRRSPFLELNCALIAIRKQQTKSCRKGVVRHPFLAGPPNDRNFGDRGPDAWASGSSRAEGVPKSSQRMLFTHDVLKILNASGKSALGPMKDTNDLLVTQFRRYFDGLLCSVLKIEGSTT